MKKFLYFLLFICIVLGAILLYFLLSKGGYLPPIKNFPKDPFGLLFDRTVVEGGGGAPTTPKPGKGDTGGTTVTPLPAEKLFERVWGEPVAGYTFIEKMITESTSTIASGKTIFREIPVSSSTLILFVDRAAGHVYKKEAFSTSSPFKLANTTMPGIYDAYFLNGGSEILMRYLRTSDNTIVSIMAKLPPLSSLVTLPLRSIQKLPDNIVSVATNRDGGKLSYLVKTNSGSTLYTYENGFTKKVGDYELSELTLSYAGDELLLMQKPSAFEKTYTLTSDQKHIYGGRTGQKLLFSSISKDTYVSSFWSNVGLSLFTSTVKNTNIHTYNAKTLAEKCVSSSLGRYFYCAVPQELPVIPFGFPDDWYKGLVSFNDSLYILDTVSFNENKIALLEDELGEPFDLIKPVVSTGDTYLAFSNKTNGTLWLTKLLKLSLR